MDDYFDVEEFNEDEEEFEVWETDEEQFERWYQESMVERTCSYCETKFMGREDHGVCNSCADKIERGEDLYY